MVEQRGLTGICVPDDGHPTETRTLAGLRLGLTYPGDLTEITLELVHPTQKPAAVDLELGLATALPGTDATALPRQRGTTTPQTGKAIADLSEFDLGLALEAVGVLPEDVEDDCRAIDGGALEQLLEVALLGGAEFVVEHHRVGVERLAQLAQFLDLARTQIRRWVG